MFHLVMPRTILLHSHYVHGKVKVSDGPMGLQHTAWDTNVKENLSSIRYLTFINKQQRTKM